jgi:pimeloyl-ACP methyl ester carboxylesterase
MTESQAPAKLFATDGGAGSPTLVLLHGLGANAAVWEAVRPILNEHWRGRWIAPDLRGHGRSHFGGPYGYGVHAADVAALLSQNHQVIVAGHSMGGVVAMALGTGWFGIQVQAVLAFGVKLAWERKEIEKIRQFSQTPVHFFERRDEAVDRYLRGAGLKGLLDSNSSAAGVGVREEGQRFRVAVDPLAYAVVGPDVADLVSACRAPLRLAAGSNDPMVTSEQMRVFDPHAVVLNGLGHNPHVEAPDKFWQLLESTLQTSRPPN